MSRVDHFDAATVLPVMRHVAAALRAAHGAGKSTARDAQPNIFWLSDGRVVVTDLADGSVARRTLGQRRTALLERGAAGVG